ncbi:MAG: FtsW/RodA/SpoVE family cell cycle protein [Planctomycetes bacterium]|nr:FtsW/RodA/SpoVE family cell cycle protein [Planctomycetota bacterium]
MIQAIKDYLRHFTWPILLTLLALLAISVLAIHVAGKSDEDVAGCAVKQLAFAAVGLAVFFLATTVHYQRVGQASYTLFAGTLVLLVAVLLFPDRRGSHRWIYMPWLSQITFQPSELAKLTFIIALAWYLRYRDSYRRLAGLIVPFVITLIPLGLILMEPDLGTALLLLPTLMVMLFMAGAKLRHVLVIVAMGLAAILLPMPRPVDKNVFAAEADKFDSWRLGPATFYHPRQFYRPDGTINWGRMAAMPAVYCRLQLGDGGVFDLQPLSLMVMEQTGRQYQVKRIEGWLRQDDPRTRASIGYQQYYSTLILGSGRWFGMGAWKKAAGGYFQMIPDEHTDFIFSVIGAQWGFVGCAGVLALYVIIFVFGADIASVTRDPFGRLLAVGVLALMAAQIFINIGMTMGLMPITGMTLPLVSYGGSSLLVNCAALGLLVNVGRHRQVSLAPKPFEFDGD